MGRKVEGSIPDGVIGIFNDFTFRPHYGSGVDSACNINEYQEYLLKGTGDRCVRLTTFPTSYTDCLEVLGASSSSNPQSLSSSA